MEAELLTLATSGATTMVGLMVSESWAQARARLAAFFGRDSGDTDVAELELETSQRELTAAREAGDEQVVADVEAEWRTRLRRVLRTDPVAAADLRALLDELAPLVGDRGETTSVVHNTISGGEYHAPVQQGRDFARQTFHTTVANTPHTSPGSGNPAEHG
ncbi:hypothetical protein [Embleya sp. AB8]|uniref:hypothetical protein n=1 Tax=Embleya sp. AB8 TaxID=3156304 RepID=UPI003C7122EA